MKDLKYRWNTRCLYDYRGVEAHLSAMAAQGMLGTAPSPAKAGL